MEHEVADCLDVTPLRPDDYLLGDPAVPALVGKRPTSERPGGS
jgi:hypothetical protein